MSINKDLVLKTGLALGTTITKVNGVALTDGQLLIGNSATGAMSVATLASLNGASITNGNGTISVSTNATNLNTVSTIVARDGSGNFSAGTITAALTGNATSATTAAALTTARTINGTAFDGTANITFTTDATAEGTTNKYYLDSRARAAISVSGSLAYNSSTGVLSYTTPVTTVFGRTGAIVMSSSDVTTALGYTPVNAALLGANSGVATLDSTGKLTTSQMPAALVGAVVYQGTWNANTNTPTLASGTGTKGQYYKVSVAGSTSIDGITNWQVNDSIIFDGTTWDKLDGDTNEVYSFNTRTGAVTLTSGDVTTALGFTPYNSTNPSNFITSAGAPVQTVAGRTGAVVLANTDISGLGTMSTHNATAIAVTGGTINGTTIGATTPSTGAFTTLAVISQTLNSVAAKAASSTAVTTTSATAVDSWPVASFRSAKYVIQVTDTTNSAYEAIEMLVIHDGTNVHAVTYGDVFTGAASMGTFDATISAGTLTLTFTALVASTKAVKVSRDAIAV
jgi:hypothetical protein